MKTLFAVLTLFIIANAHDDLLHVCVHGKHDVEPDLIDLAYSDNSNGRFLKDFQNMRINFDYTKIADTSSEFRRYLTDVIIPPTKNYFESALKVRPMDGNLKLNLSQTCGGTIDVPEIYRTEGVQADLVLFVDLVDAPDETFVAHTITCALSTKDKRPAFGKLVYNTARLRPSTNKVQIERDILVTLHETTHVLAFSQLHYKNFINPITNQPLEGHIFTKQVNGNPVTVLNLEPLTKRLRKHFGCPTLEGAYLENQGKAGSLGSHFERRILSNEYMTASTNRDAKVTEFSLALLEGSGWYEVDYSLAEPITWGKNQGCNFLDTPCFNKETGKPNFKEFCSPLASREVVWSGRGAGVCGAANIKSDLNIEPNMDYWGNKTAINDVFADNCPTYSMFTDMDCEDEDLQLKSTLPTKEFYGVGSKSFKGTLANLGSETKPSFYCFRPTCTLQSNGKYSLKVNVGDKKVTCKSQKEVSVPGLMGRISCPNVQEFCEQITSEGFCKRGCFGRGKCVNRECQCDYGWGGPDCSKQEDNCKRCEGADPFRTSCFGDSCECNPANITCVLGKSSSGYSILPNMKTNSDQQYPSAKGPNNLIRRSNDRTLASNNSPLTNEDNINGVGQIDTKMESIDTKKEGNSRRLRSGEDGIN